jgi:hypothetical protein
VKNEKNNNEASEFLDLLPESTKRFPPNPTQAVKAMNRYCESFIKNPVRDFRMDYALLCDYVHHPQGGTRSFVTVHRETEKGWFLSYGRNEMPTPEQVKVLLRIILPSMGIGYANALMLYYGVCEDENSEVLYYHPPDEVKREVWRILEEGLDF